MRDDHRTADRRFRCSSGGTTWNVNHLVPITRNGRREDVLWTYSYGYIDERRARPMASAACWSCATRPRNKSGDLTGSRSSATSWLSCSNKRRVSWRCCRAAITGSSSRKMRRTSGSWARGPSSARPSPRRCQRSSGKASRLLDRVFASGTAFVAHGAQGTTGAPDEEPDGPVPRLHLSTDQGRRRPRHMESSSRAPMSPSGRGQPSRARGRRGELPFARGRAGGNESPQGRVRGDARARAAHRLQRRSPARSKSSSARPPRRRRPPPSR